MNAGLEGKVMGELMAPPFSLPIVQGKHGPDLGRLTDEQLAVLAGSCDGKETKIIVVVMYDITPDPEAYARTGSYLNFKSYNHHAKIFRKLNGLIYKPDLGKAKSLSCFLEERGKREEELSGRRRDSMFALVYHVAVANQS